MERVLVADDFRTCSLHIKSGRLLIMPRIWRALPGVCPRPLGSAISASRPCHECSLSWWLQAVVLGGCVGVGIGVGGGLVLGPGGNVGGLAIVGGVVGIGCHVLGPHGKVVLAVVVLGRGRHGSLGGEDGRRVNSMNSAKKATE